MDQIALRWTLGLGSCRETSWHGRLMDSHCPFIGTECDTWCLDGALLPPLTPHKHAVCCGLFEWLDTEWYLLLQRSILSAVLLASIKMDHSVNSNRVKCRRVRVSCFPQVLQIPKNWETQWIFFFIYQECLPPVRWFWYCRWQTAVSFYYPYHLCHSYVGAKSNSQVTISTNTSMYIKTILYYRCLIGSPLSSLSSISLDKPCKDTIIHHPTNLFCHFPFG